MRKCIDNKLYIEVVEMLMQELNEYHIQFLDTKTQRVYTRELNMRIKNILQRGLK